MKDRFEHIRTFLLLCKVQPEIVSDVRIDSKGKLHVTTVYEKKVGSEKEITGTSGGIPSNSIEWVIDLNKIPPLGVILKI